MMTNTLSPEAIEADVPRVSLPGVDQAQVEAVDEQMKEYRARWNGFVLAMMRTGKPFANKPKRGKRKPTKHVRHMRTVKARVETLRFARGMEEFAANTTPGGTWIEEGDE